MIMTTFTHLIRNDQPWEVEAENAFQSLKASFTTTSLLIHVNPSKLFVLEMDAFNFALRFVFSQLRKIIFFI
jgi:hypothetical protein